MDVLQPLQAILGFIALLSFLTMLASKHRRTAAEVPEVAGGWPIIGHLRLLGGPRPIMRTLAALADKYGPVFSIRVGVHRTVVVSSAALAKECFTANDRALASRPLTTAGKHLGSDFALFSFSPYGAYWREIRKLVMLHFLSPSRLELLRPARAAEIDLCVKQLHRLWRRNGDAPVAVDMMQYFQRLALNNVVISIAGKRYFGTEVEEEEKEARKFHRVVERFFYLGGLFVLSDAVPYTEWMDVGGHVAEMKSIMKELDSIVSGWVEEHRRRRLSGERAAAPDFIDVMLDILETTKLPEFDPETIVKTTSWALILGGSDTIFITLTWALSLLLNHPQALRFAQAEIDTVIGRDRNVDGSDIADLPYLRAIIKETLRLYPPAPISVPHEALEDCRIGGHCVAAGTRVIVNVWKIQRDPLNWPEPNEFQPERFLASEVDLKGHHFELIPFSSGRRMCPGMGFALQVMHLTLARLIHGFEMRTRTGGLVDMEEGLGVTLPRAAPLEVVFSPRLSSHLYV